MSDWSSGSASLHPRGSKPGGFRSVPPLSGGYRTSTARLDTTLPPGHCLREQAEDLPHHGDTDERGVAAHVEGRRDFHDVAADQIEPTQAAQYALRLVRGVAADLRRAGARRIGGIEAVDVEADIGRAVAHDAAGLGDHLVHAEVEILLDGDHPHALLDRPHVVVALVERAADADLDHALGVQKALLDGAAERRA